MFKTIKKFFVKKFVKLHADNFPNATLDKILRKCVRLPIYFSRHWTFRFGCLVENVKIVETLRCIGSHFCIAKTVAAHKKVHVLKIEFLLSSEIDSNKLVLPVWFFSSFF